MRIANLTRFAGKLVNPVGFTDSIARHFGEPTHRTAGGQGNVLNTGYIGKTSLLAKQVKTLERQLETQYPGNCHMVLNLDPATGQFYAQAFTHQKLSRIVIPTGDLQEVTPDTLDKLAQRARMAVGILQSLPEDTSILARTEYSKPENQPFYRVRIAHKREGFRSPLDIHLSYPHTADFGATSSEVRYILSQLPKLPRRLIRIKRQLAFTPDTSGTNGKYRAAAELTVRLARPGRHTGSLDLVFPAGKL